MYNNNAQMHCILDLFTQKLLEGSASERHLISILNYFILHGQIKHGQISFYRGTSCTAVFTFPSQWQYFPNY